MQSARGNSRYPLAGQVVISPGNASTIVARSTFGMLSSSDAGKSWTWVCESAIGYFGVEDPPIAVTGDGTTLVASTIGISVSHDGGCSWRTNPGLTEARFGVDVTVQPAHPEQAFALISGRVDGSYLVWLARSDDNGATFTEIEPPLPRDFVATTVEVAPTNPLRVYVSGKITSTQQGAIQRSDDGGLTWTASLLDVHGSPSIYIGAVDPLDADVIYIRTLSDVASRVIASRDAGATWKDVWSAPGDVPGMALSADGSTMALGGPMAGINIASTADWAFRQTSKVGTYCLSWLGNDSSSPAAKRPSKGSRSAFRTTKGLISLRSCTSPTSFLDRARPEPPPRVALPRGDRSRFKSAWTRGPMARRPRRTIPSSTRWGTKGPLAAVVASSERRVPRFRCCQQRFYMRQASGDGPRNGVGANL